MLLFLGALLSALKKYIKASLISVLMAKEMTRGITVKKEEDISEWYNQIIEKAELAEFSEVKGCLVIRPNGMAIWEAMQQFFDKAIKSHGVRNAYFPIFIPEKYFKLEAEHAEGFTPEVAWVTHAGDEPLPERLAIRPTSETVMCTSFARWVRSHRDLPVLINQWCNVVRWETKSTRPFLRSREFLWQEGHCLHATQEENEGFVKLILMEYKRMFEELHAVPVLVGVKTAKEKFAGARNTFACEAFMPDGKALQMATSHDLGQGFVKTFNIRYTGEDGQEHMPFHNSWGFSTRSIGGMVMVHSDNNGLVLPPRIAYNKVVIIPIMFDKSRTDVLKACEKLKQELSEFNPILDDREEYSPGWKFNEYELKGIPIRIELGPRDLDSGQAVLVRRDKKEKQFVKLSDMRSVVAEELEQMHHDLFDKAEEHLKSLMVSVDNWDDFVRLTGEGKLVKIPFCGEPECEDWIKEKTKGVTSRCIPLEGSEVKPGTKCLHCGKDAKYMTFFSRSY